MAFVIVLIFFGIVGIIANKYSNSVEPSTLSTLVKKKKITKEQFIQIQKFETEEKIKKWQKAGLITKEQAEAILAPPSKSKWISVSATLLWLGLGCILVGIIAVIAANYDKIPPMVRLSTTFALFLASCLGLFRFWIQKKQKVMEYFIVASVALTGALIGLICQTFHLRCEIPNAICLWSILALPFISLSKFKSWAVTWYPVFIISFLGSSYGRDALRFLSHYNPVIILIAVTLLAFDVYKLMSFKLPNNAFTEILKLYVTFWTIIAIITIDFGYVNEMFPPSFSTNNIYAYLIMCLSLIPIFLSSIKNRLYNFYIAFLVIFSAIACLVSFPIIGILFTLITLGFFAVYCAKNNQLTIFNTTCVVFFFRILLAYVNLFMSLLNTGISAIILGILILLGVYLWSKKRQSLIIYIQKGK